MVMIHFYRSSKRYGSKEILNERYDSSQVLANMSSLLVFLKGIKKKREREYRRRKIIFMDSTERFNKVTCPVHQKI
jgi:hypothetical protein